MIGKIREQIFVGVLVGLILLTLSTLAQSDSPPWAGKVRVMNLSSHIIQDEIRNLWLNQYCLAEKNRNHYALAVSIDEINRLEEQFQDENGGRALALPPCP